MRSYPRSLVFVALVLGAVGLGGCLAGNGAALLVLLVAGTAVIAGCADDGPRTGRCCLNGKVNDHCICDAGSGTCNFALYDVTGDGTCALKVFPPPMDAPSDSPGAPPPVDAAADMSIDTPADVSADLIRDAGEDRPGMAYRCCPNGRIETCYCPPLTACNYGVIVDCGDGTCYEHYFPNLDAGYMCKARDGGGQ